MNDLRRVLGVSLWLTLVLIAYDIARIPSSADLDAGSLGYLAGAALLGVKFYGAAALAALTAALILARTAAVRRAIGLGPRASALPILSGAATALAVTSFGIAAMGERRGAAAFGTPAWNVDLLVVVAGAAASAAGAAAAVRRAATVSRPRLALAALAILPALPALIGMTPLLARVLARPVAPKSRGVDAAAPDIVLIVADTLRVDAVGCYGNTRVRTPAIDALAASGVRFTASTSQASWTNPSTATLLTSRYPCEHGMVGYQGRISADARTLAEALSDRGYETAGLVANLLVSRSYGFDRGFDFWDQDPDRRPIALYSQSLATRVLRAVGLESGGVHTAPASEMVDRAISYLSRPAAAPRFLYLHLMDPHEPYTPPPDLARTADPGYAGKLDFKGGTLYAILRGEIPVTDADLRHGRALYDAEVSGMDREIGRLLDRLREPIDAGKTIVAFTADHGEEFMEHGALGHEHTLYEELIHVPLLLVRKGTIPAGLTVADPVRSMDLAPTLLDIAGLPREASFHGRSLMPAVRGESRAAPGPIFSEEDYIGYRTTSPRMRSVRIGDVKVILYEPNIFGIGPWRREAFDLASDPGEKAPLDAIAGGAPELEAALRDWMAQSASRRKGWGELDPEIEHRLRALGYIQ